MGTKGRDALLWLFFALMLVAILIHAAAKTLFVVAVLDAALFLYYCAWEHPSAVRKSKEMGMRIVVLLPVNVSWAKLLLRLDGDRVGCFCGAYEVHIKGGKQSLGDYLRLFTSDLEIAQRTFPGAIFMWETSAPLPLFVRRLIRQGTAVGSAFLKDGRWPIPRFPFTGRHEKKGRVRHGAIIA